MSSVYDLICQTMGWLEYGGNRKMKHRNNNEVGIQENMFNSWNAWRGTLSLLSFLLIQSITSYKIIKMTLQCEKQKRNVLSVAELSQYFSGQENKYSCFIHESVSLVGHPNGGLLGEWSKVLWIWTFLNWWQLWRWYISKMCFFFSFVQSNYE